jgi:tripartite ATP-independent transporter DctP family solute receptor
MFGISSSSAAPVVIKISNPVTENSTWYKGLLKFKEIIEEKTSGKYEVQIYNSDQLTAGNQTQALEMIQMGATDFDCRGMVIHTVLDDRFTVVNMPFILPDLETVDKILSGSGKEALFQFASENGLHPLALGESGYRQITSGPKAIRVPADMKNLKVRIPSMPMFFDLFEILGANPTTINMSEVFTALQQGVIDAHENPLDVSRSYKINEVQKYITLWNAVYDPILFCCSEQFWARLSDEEKTLFQNASYEALNYHKQLVRS